MHFFHAAAHNLMCLLCLYVSLYIFSALGAQGSSTSCVFCVCMYPFKFFQLSALKVTAAGLKAGEADVEAAAAVREEAELLKGKLKTIREQEHRLQVASRLRVCVFWALARVLCVG